MYTYSDKTKVTHTCEWHILGTKFIFGHSMYNTDPIESMCTVHMYAILHTHCVQDAMVADQIMTVKPVYMVCDNGRWS